MVQDNRFDGRFRFPFRSIWGPPTQRSSEERRRPGEEVKWVGAEEKTGGKSDSEWYWLASHPMKPVKNGGKNFVSGFRCTHITVTQRSSHNTCTSALKIVEVVRRMARSTCDFDDRKLQQNYTTFCTRCGNRIAHSVTQFFGIRSSDSFPNP